MHPPGRQSDRRALPSQPAPGLPDTRSSQSCPAVLPLALGGCGEVEPPDDETGLSPEQEVFWTNLEGLCGAAFVGEPLEAPSDSDRRESELVMHVRDEIRISLHVDDDRSRTWLVTRTDTAIRPHQLTRRG